MLKAKIVSINQRATERAPIQISINACVGNDYLYKFFITKEESEALKPGDVVSLEHGEEIGTYVLSRPITVLLDT